MCVWREGWGLTNDVMNGANGVFMEDAADSLRVEHVRTRRGAERLLRHSCSRGGFFFSSACSLAACSSA